MKYAVSVVAYGIVAVEADSPEQAELLVYKKRCEFDFGALLNGEMADVVDSTMLYNEWVYGDEFHEASEKYCMRESKKEPQVHWCWSCGKMCTDEPMAKYGFRNIVYHYDGTVICSNCSHKFKLGEDGRILFSGENI